MNTQKRKLFLQTACLVVSIILFTGLFVPRSPLPVHAQEGTTNPYFASRIVILPDGTSLTAETISGPSRTPEGFETDRQVVTLPEPGSASTTKVLSVPAYLYYFGPSAVSAAMIAAYYDRSGYPNMYTGPTNSGVMPMTDSGWPTWTDGAGNTYNQNPLTASHIGMDGRTIRGSIEDYWASVSGVPDPYITGGWAQHAWGTAVGDYMKTSQSAYLNDDGATTFYFSNTTAAPFTCANMAATLVKDYDSTYGRKLFYEARGFAVTDCYNQKTDNAIAGGFSFAQYKAQIDAGRPVMLFLAGLTITGIGYNDAGNTVYLRDNWDYNVHSMIWGGGYSGMAMQGVSIVNLADGDPPDGFHKSYPAEDATKVRPSITSIWQASSGAAGYQYCYYRVVDGACSSWSDTIPLTAVALSGLDWNTAYYWQVRAVNAYGTTYADEAHWWMFTTRRADDLYYFCLPMVIWGVR